MTQSSLTAEEREYYAALQSRINALYYWRFEGSVGRTLANAIKDGVCLLGFSETHDYYDNHIPSRDQVKTGTAGSYEYVRKLYGKKYADFISSVDDPGKSTGRARLINTVL